MSVDVINPVQQNENSAPVGSTSSASTPSAADVDYEMFLQLLVAQMQNQDPLNPAESTEYVAQLATFSQVEQTIQSNAKLDQMISSLSMSQLDAVIGRNITSADGSVSGKVESVKVYSDGLVAHLDGGGTVLVGPGVTIS